MGSGLIPLKANGQPDVAKIVTRLIALVAGAAVLGPVLRKLAEKLKPLFEPIFGILKEGFYSMIGYTGAGQGTLLEYIGACLKRGWEGLLSNIIPEAPDVQNIEDYNKDNSVKTAFDNKQDRQFGLNAYKSKNPYKKGTTNYALYEAAKHDSGAYKALNEQTTYLSNFASADDEITFLIAVDKYHHALSVYSSLAYKFQWANVLPTAFNLENITNRIASTLTGGSFFDLNSSAETKRYDYSNERRFTSDERSYITLAINETDKWFSSDYNGFANSAKSRNMFMSMVKKLTGITLEYVKDGYNGYSYRVSNLEKIHKSTLTRATEDVANRAKIIEAEIKYQFPLQASSYGINQTTDEWGAARITGLENKDYYNTEKSSAEYENPNWVDEDTVQGIGYGYTQNDPRWSSMGYGRYRSGKYSTMGSGGCGPTAMANVYNNLTGRNINPAQMARFSQANGYNAQGGTSAGLFTSGARKLGLRSNAISKSGAAIGRSIRNGNNVLIAGKNGAYTKAGHIMSVRGVDGNGNAIVDDPLKRGARRISMNTLTKGMTHAWSIGNGTGTAPDGSAYTYYSDLYNPSDVSFNVLGGAFGYNGSNVGGPSTMDGACIYNSFTNAYINAALPPDMPFVDFVKTINGLTPSVLKTTGRVTSYNGDSGVTNYDTLKSELMAALGLSNINVVNHEDPLGYNYEKNPEKAQLIFDEIISNLSHGNPILFSVNNGDSTGDLGLISASYNHGKYDTPYSRYYQHGVMLVGLKKGPSGTYNDGSVVIDNPARTGINQIQEMEIGKFKNTILQSGYAPYIHRLVYFERDPNAMAELKRTYEGMFTGAKRDSSGNAYKAFVEKYGEEALTNGYSTYEDYISNIIAKSSASAVASGGTSGYASGGTSGVSGYTSGGTATNSPGNGIVDWIADLASKLGQFASNLIGKLITGEGDLLDGVFTSGSSYSSGGGSYSSSGGYTGGSYQYNINFEHTTGQVAVFLAEAVKMESDELNDALSKNGFSTFTISKDKYDKLTNDSSRNALIISTISENSKYWDNVVDLVKTKSSTYAAVYTWIIAMGMFSASSKSTDKAAFAKSCDARVGSVYNRLKNITLPISSSGIPIDGYVTPTTTLAEYERLPEWAKIATGGLQFYPNPGFDDLLYRSAIDYSSMLTPINEAGVKYPPASYEELEKMYFRIYNDTGKPSFGRTGFHFSGRGYPGDNIFQKLMAHPDSTVQEAAKKYYDYVYSKLGSFPSSPKYEVISGPPEFLNALIQAEDAGNIELKSEYMKMMHGVNPNITDPRMYALGAEMMPMAPYSIMYKVNAQSLEAMRDSFSGHRLDRARRDYNLMTTGSSSDGSGVWQLPTFEEFNGISVGNGDAGYNMRDNIRMYSDDIYMGDADHPMNVTMDNSPVTNRLDKLVELVDLAVNGVPEPVSNGSNAKSVSIGNGPGRQNTPITSKKNIGQTNITQHDTFARIHNNIAKRTRTSVNYNQY